MHFFTAEIESGILTAKYHILQSHFTFLDFRPNLKRKFPKIKADSTDSVGSELPPNNSQRKSENPTSIESSSVFQIFLL